VRTAALKEVTYLELASTAELPLSGFEGYLLDGQQGVPFAKGDVVFAQLGHGRTGVIWPHLGN
jgi:hypothetical protein